ncbi:hypothetical protein LSH36_1658g00002 [Paralvinella palmiformis]|uniref:C-type lectin domain-containing protein n=1 Tax=Paralvinella palmiformis TaxID=53620 RepID=A0AAD9ISX1_9ANNE|nr:hypothetical protein LSH36_1658g00002 [Paralvinella palmiformis]
MIQEQSDEEGEKHRQETLAAGFTRYFLGGRRPHNGNIREFYLQPSGVPISYSRWHPSQPYPRDDDSNCIMARIDHDWLWNDNRCRTPSMYMCHMVYDG